MIENEHTLAGGPDLLYHAGDLAVGMFAVTGRIDGIHIRGVGAASAKINSGDTIVLADTEAVNINYQYRLRNLTLETVSGTVRYLITYVPNA